MTIIYYNIYKFEIKKQKIIYQLEEILDGIKKIALILYWANIS